MFLHLFGAVLHLIDVSTITPSITASDFQKAFLRSANIANGPRRHALTNGNGPGEPLVPWRELALKSLENNKLGDTLERAIESLPVKCSEVLFLHDMKNLDLEETARMLNINIGEVEALLICARIQVYDALMLSVRAGEEENISVPLRWVFAAWVEHGGQQLDALTAYL